MVPNGAKKENRTSCSTIKYHLAFKPVLKFSQTPSLEGGVFFLSTIKFENNLTKPCSSLRVLNLFIGHRYHVIGSKQVRVAAKQTHLKFSV